MKKITILFLAALAFSSCDLQSFKKDKLSAQVSADVSEIFLSPENEWTAGLNVKSDGRWMILVPEGLDIEPSFGSGDTDVLVSLSTLEQFRGTAEEFILTVCGTGCTIPVHVYIKWKQ